MPNHLTKRGDIYYAQVIVPDDVKEILGRKVFKKSTGHRQLKNAELTAGPWVTDWWKLIDEARTAPDAVLEKIAKLKALHTQQKQDEEYFDFEYEYGRDGKRTGNRKGYTDAELTLEGYLDDLEERLPPSEFQKYKRLYYGVDGIPLGLFIDSWIRDEYPKSKYRTLKEAKTAIENVIQYFPTFADLTISNRQKWLKDQTRAKGTAQKQMGYVRSYYQWLKMNQHIGASETNPFHIDDIAWPKRLTEKKSYLPFTVAELLQLKQAALNKGDLELVRFMDIAQFTGMRLAEVAQISKDSRVTEDGIHCIKVKEEAKSRASGNRVIPIAATLAGRVAISELPTPASVKYEGQEVGKRFGRLKTKLGFGSLHVFHSIRKTATTVFEQAGVTEGITADILGHEKQTMTYGLYSGGTSIKQRKEAMDAFEALMLQREAEFFNSV